MRQHLAIERLTHQISYLAVQPMLILYHQFQGCGRFFIQQHGHESVALGNAQSIFAARNGNTCNVGRGKCAMSCVNSNSPEFMLLTAIHLSMWFLVLDPFVIYLPE